MAVAIIFDILIVLTAVLCVVIGLKKGFIKMFVLRFRKLTSVILAILLAKPIGALLNKRVFSDIVVNWVMSSGKITDVPADSPEALLETVPGVLRFFAKIFGYDLERVATNAFENGHGMQKEIITELSYPVSSFISVILTFIVLYIVLRILIKVLSGVIENFFELPGLRQINAISGAFVAFVLNAVIIWVLCRILGWLLTTDLVSNWSFIEGFTMEKTYIAKYIYEFNPLAFIFSVNPE